MKIQEDGYFQPGYVHLLCHFSFWFGLVFATPLFVALNNIDGIALEPKTLAIISALICLVLSLAGWALSRLAPPRIQPTLSCVFLTLAMLAALQGNWVHGLFEFGVFDGRPIDFRENPTIFWLEWLGWLGTACGLFWLLLRIKQIPLWLPVLPVLSFCLLLAPAITNPPQAGLEIIEETKVDPSVYAFSSIANLIHLLPDGFQGDTVRQVLEDDPGLASRFEGFILFTDHLGRYPGTAPSLYSMLTGQPFPLERGFNYSWVGPETKKLSYQTELARQGYQVDLVPISNYICPENASSCHPRLFNNEGYNTRRDNSLSHSLRLLADMTLFRLTPSFLKEKIYDHGYWLLSDIAADESSPRPDPILREWTEKLHVVDDRPVYKWYHYIGTHVPPRWDASCDLRRELKPSRENYLAQTQCVLEGIASLLDRLQAAGIYEQTAIIISGDHGHNTVPIDQVSRPMNYSMYEPLLGTGRPALLLKPRNTGGPLKVSQRPSNLLNIAPTALELAGLPGNGATVFDLPEVLDAPRIFEHYPIEPFWSGNPVPYIEYQVGQPASNATLWALSDIVSYVPGPSEYSPVNKETARGHMYGARLRSSVGQNKSSWIQGQQLAFSIDLPEMPDGGTLDLELSFEPWMQGQSFSVQINGGDFWKSGIVSSSEMNGAWSTYKIPIEHPTADDGHDFVSIIFEQIYNNPGVDEQYASARIRAVRITTAR